MIALGRYERNANSGREIESGGLEAMIYLAAAVINSR
jgi:hypothetical protein